MIFTQLPLEGLCLISTEPFTDHRGSFARLFCRREFREIGLEKPLAQINLSQTIRKGTVRGLHMQQAPHAEVKVVRCIRGAVFDVAVDMRRTSPTYLKWHGEILSPENGNALYVPEGFAHGFQALEPHSDLMYFVSEYYAADAEAGCRYDDPAFGIEWPLDVENVSEKDLACPFI